MRVSVSETREFVEARIEKDMKETPNWGAKLVEESNIARFPHMHRTASRLSCKMPHTKSKLTAQLNSKLPVSYR